MHRAAVALPHGTRVVPVSFDPDDPYARDAPPDFGLYLDDRWQPPWAHAHVAWPDFGTPGDPMKLEAALRSLLDRARDGQRVELGCLGGHGRTGTALACLAVMTGTPPHEAVALVRGTYCDRAIESPSQEEFVAKFTPRY
jgi:protein-tyrosine phosphatase